jgi:hypothetical protein
MKLDPIVMIKLGARMLRKEGNVVVARNVEAKRSTTPPFVNL